MKSMFQLNRQSLSRAVLLLVALCNALSVAGQALQPTYMPVQEATLYPGMSQDVRSFNFYSFQILNKTAAFMNSSYLSIRVDIDDPTSDPDILVAKPNSARAPKSEAESDQYCVKAGSNVCMLRKNYYKPNDTILFSVRCINKCTYTLRIAFSPVTNVTDGSKLPMRLDGRSNSVFQFQIPDTSYDGPTQSIYLQVDTNSTTSQISIYYSATDDLTLMEERDADIITDTGKAIKFSQDDYGWCTKCSVYFVVSVRSPDAYLISAKSTSRKEFLQDQIPLSRQFEQQQRECLAYTVNKAANDAVFYVKQSQGDLDVSLFFRSALNPSLETQVIQSEVSSQRALIARSADRQRFNQSTGPIYLCANPYTDASLTVVPSQQYQLGRFDAQEDTLYTFNLDSSDYIYFRYTSPALAVSRQIQIQVQSFNSNFSIPRVFYRVCPSPNAEECSLTDNLAMGYWDGNVILSEIISTTDPLTNIRTGVINHNPQSCPIPTQCYYVISVFNQDPSSVQKFTYKLNLVNPDPIPISLFQQYQDIVNQGASTYFTLMLTQNQLANLNINQIYFNLTTFNGKADLFLSTSTRNPNINNYEMRARSLSPWVQIAFNASGRDLTKTNIYVAVYGNIQSQYQFKIGADYTLNNPTTFQNVTFNTSGNNQTTPNITALVQNVTNQTSVVNNSNPSGLQNTTNLTIYTTPMVEGMRGSYQLSSNMTDMILFYQPTFQPSSQRTIHFSPTIDASITNATLFFNVTYGNQTWNNNTIGLTLTPDQWVYNPANIFIVRIRGDFSKVNRAALNITNLTQNKNISNTTTKVTAQNIQLNMTIRFGIFSAYQSNNFINYTQLNTNYEGYANYTTVVFEHLLMDTNGTYVFSLYNSIGKPFLMQKNGPLLLQDYDITDDTTYDFASSSVDTQETQTITVTKFMRENANFRCKNASYPLRGGNENCTMFIAIQCNQLCIFNLSITLLEAKNRTVDVPILFKEGQQLQNQSITYNAVNNYYVPFMRGSLGDTAIALNKLQGNDSFLVAKIISNGYLPYYSWSYPTTTSYDIISKNPSNNFELIDLSSGYVLSKCPTNSSCILLITVFSSSVVNTSVSTYRLRFLSSQNRMGNATLINGFITTMNTYNYYWFLVNNTNTSKTAVVNQATWKHIITVATTGNIGDQEVDLYLSTSDGYSPTSENYDFKGDRLGNDAITLSSDSAYFKNSTRDKYLVVIGVKARSNNVTYQLMNWGPNNYDSQLITFSDIYLKSPQNFTLPSKTTKPVNNYKILRFFNYGYRDLTINITATDGSVYVLANKNNFKHYEVNSYFTVPIVPQLSKITPYNLNKTQTYVFKINKSTNNQTLCTFCWLYIAVFQNNTVATATSSFVVNITDTSMNDFIPNIKVGETQSSLITLKGSAIQRKFIFDSKEQFTLQVMSNNTSFSVYLGYYSDYLNNDRVWQATGNTRQVFKMKQSDRNYLIGSYYFVTVVSNEPMVNVTISLNQRRSVTLLRDQSNILDRMQTSEDYIKYYYFIPPTVPTNYSVTINVTPRTQGFFPSFYAQRNDLINNTFGYKQLTFPSMNRSTFQQEQQFFLPAQTTYSFTFNVSSVNYFVQTPINVTQNVTVNQTVLVNVTMNVTNSTTKKNQTVVVQQNQTVQVNQTRNVTIMQNQTVINQTYYTLAVYWNNFGLTDLQRAEFEISCSIRPLGKNMVVLEPYKKGQLTSIPTSSHKFLQHYSAEDDEQSNYFLQSIQDQFGQLVDLIQFI